MKDIMKTTNYCHDKGIVHRDLKFENILFADEKKDQIKIIDFGIAGLFHAERITAGSIDYSPPEVVGGWSYESDCSMDVWSIGCLLLEAITGTKMFQGADLQEKKVIKSF
jgi:serine/threonine protein kinase